MKKVVIVGAGPIGLYLAIRLKQLGVENITIVDPRVDEYVRPGDLDEDIFGLLEKNIGLPIKYSSARHLKDAERSLLQIAKDLNITIEKKKCTGLAPQGIYVVDKNGTTDKISSDVLLDCTGFSHILVNSLNAAKPYFDIKRMADNPIKTHFFAHVEMNFDDIIAVKEGLGSSEDPAAFMVGLYHLQSHFGWPHPTEPFNEIHPILPEDAATLTEPPKTGKVFIYCETPKNLPVDKREAWIKALLSLHAGKDIDFKQLTSNKAIPKPRFLPVNVDPHQVEPLFFKGDENTPPIIPLGDALAGSDYRFGKGTTQGVECVEAFIKAIIINDKEISKIDFDGYAAKVTAILSQNKAQLNLFYDSNKKTLKKSLKTALTQVDELIDECTDPDQKKILIKMELSLQHKYAMENYNEALTYLKKIQNKDGTFKVNKQGMADHDLLTQATNHLFIALKELPKKKVDDREKIYLALKGIANQYLAEAKYNEKDFAEASILFYKALSLYKKMDINKHKNETLKIYADLMSMAVQQQNYDYGIIQSYPKHIRHLLKENSLEEPEKSSVCESAFLNSALIHIGSLHSYCGKNIENIKNYSKNNQEFINQHLTAINDAFEYLNTHHATIPPKELQTMKEKYQVIKSGLGIEDSPQEKRSTKRNKP